MSETKKTIIDKNTLVPIGAVLAIISMSVFAGNLSTKVDVNVKRIDKIENKLDTIATKDDLAAAVKSVKEYIDK